MIKVHEVGEVFTVESQYSDTTTEMVVVRFIGASPSQKANSASLLGEIDGIEDLGLGGVRQVSVAIKAEHADKYPVGRVINDLYICREWTDENPYPNAVDDQGNPVAETLAIEHPEFGAIDVYSRTFLSKEKLADTWNLVGEYGDDALISAPPVVENTVVRKPATKRQTARK